MLDEQSSHLFSNDCHSGEFPCQWRANGHLYQSVGFGLQVVGSTLQRTGRNNSTLKQHSGLYRTDHGYPVPSGEGSMSQKSPSQLTNLREAKDWIGHWDYSWVEFSLLSSVSGVKYIGRAVWGSLFQCCMCCTFSVDSAQNILISMITFIQVYHTSQSQVVHLSS